MNEATGNSRRMERPLFWDGVACRMELVRGEDWNKPEKAKGRDSDISFCEFEVGCGISPASTGVE